MQLHRFKMLVLVLVIQPSKKTKLRSSRNSNQRHWIKFRANNYWSFHPIPIRRWNERGLEGHLERRPAGKDDLLNNVPSMNRSPQLLLLMKRSKHFVPQKENQGGDHLMRWKKFSRKKCSKSGQMFVICRLFLNSYLCIILCRSGWSPSSFRTILIPALRRNIPRLL